MALDLKFSLARECCLSVGGRTAGHRISPLFKSTFVMDKNMIYATKTYVNLYWEVFRQALLSSCGWPRRAPVFHVQGNKEMFLLLCAAILIPWGFQG